MSESALIRKPPAISTPVDRRCSSQELFAGKRELVIVHGGTEYRLRLTSQGKLILTK